MKSTGAWSLKLGDTGFVLKTTVAPVRPGEQAAVVANASEHLCVSCHLCCSGAMFGKLKITEAERDALGAGAETFGDGETLCLRLGCKFLGANGGCQAYERRPAGCGQYKCSLLKKLEAGEVDHGTAMERVATVRKLGAECLDAAHVALTDDYWNHDLMRTAIQAYLRTQVVHQAGVPLPADKLDEVDVAWQRYAEFVSAHFVDHVSADDFRSSLVLAGGPFDPASKGLAAKG